MIDSKDGSLKFTVNQLVDKFYRSRFNRDMGHEVGRNEDLDDSKIHRIYNKSDLLELAHSFVDFFEWVIAEQNLSRLIINENLTLRRNARPPVIKKANAVTVKYKAKEGINLDVGDYYVTNGSYHWTFEISETMKWKLKKWSSTNPDFLALKKELQKEVDKRNADARRSNKDKPSE